jgi:malonate decarboxylase alpha subunit
MTNWKKQRDDRQARLDAAQRYASGKLVTPENTKAMLEAVIRPGDRVCLEGDNQSRPIFLPRLWQALIRRASTICI